MKSQKFRHPSERIALDYMLSLGHSLVAHNIHLRYAEIDLVTYHEAKDILHFIEVKSISTQNDTDLFSPLRSFKRDDLRRKREAANSILLMISAGRVSPYCLSVPSGFNKMSGCSMDILQICNGKPVLYENYF